MSMTSKVNPSLRNQILALLAGGVKRTNKNLGVYLMYSRRAVQEATQKLTKDGALIAQKFHGQTFYALPEKNSFTPGEVVAA